MNWTTLWRVSAITLLSTGLLFGLYRSPVAARSHQATPVASGCTSIATPAAAQAEHAGHTMDMSDETMEVDLAYIDMMIPHHASIIALSQVALTELQDERLRRIAEAIIDAQDAKIRNSRAIVWNSMAVPSRSRSTSSR